MEVEEETTKLCKGAAGVADLFDKPDTMDEYATALNKKLRALAAFDDAADIDATAQHLGHDEEGHSLQRRIAKDVLSVLRQKNPFISWWEINRACVRHNVLLCKII